MRSSQLIPRIARNFLLVKPLQGADVSSVESPALRSVEEGWDHGSSEYTDLGLYRRATLWKDAMVKLDGQSESGYLWCRYDINNQTFLQW